MGEMKLTRNFLKRARTLLSPSLGKTDLPYILSQANPTQTLIAKVIWLEHLIGWIRSGAKKTETHAVRIRFILNLLERNPHWKILTAVTIRSVLKETSGLQ